MIGQALTAVRVSRHLLWLWVAPLAVRPNLSFLQRYVSAVIYPIALGAALFLHLLLRETYPNDTAKYTLVDYNCQRWYIARRPLIDD
jgi:hypothetical protein